VRWEPEPWRIAPFRAADVNAVKISSGADIATIWRSPEGWLVRYEGDHGDEPLPADAANVAALITGWGRGLEAPALRVAPTTDDEAAVGLGPGATELVILGRHEPLIAVEIGDDLGDRYAVRPVSGGALFRLALPTPVPSARSTDWADRRLFPVTADDVRSIGVAGSSEVTVWRDDPDSPWQGPPDGALRARSVDLLLATLLAMEWKQPLAIADFHGYADAMPIATTVTLADADREARTVEITAPHGPDGVVHARVGTTLFSIDAAEAKRVHEAPAHLME